MRFHVEKLEVLHFFHIFLFVTAKKYLSITMAMKNAPPISNKNGTK